MFNVTGLIPAVIDVEYARAAGAQVNSVILVSRPVGSSGQAGVGNP